MRILLLIITLSPSLVFGSSTVLITYVNNSTTNMTGSMANRWSYTSGGVWSGTLFSQNQPGGLAAGSSVTLGPYTLTGTNTMWVGVTSANGHRSTVASVPNGQTSYPITLYFGGAGVATNCVGKLSVRNDTTSYAQFFLLRDGAQTGISQTIFPGQTHVFEFSVPDCDWNHVWTVKRLLYHSGLYGDGQGGVYASDPTFGDNVAGNMAQGTNSVSPADPSPGSYGGSGSSTPFANTYSNLLNASGLPTNGPILFSSTNQQGATEATLQVGLNALRDSLAGGLGEVHSDLLTLQAINQNGFGAVSGALAGLTNGFGSDGASNAVASLHHSITNDDGRVQAAYDTVLDSVNNRGSAAASAMAGVSSEAETLLGGLGGGVVPDENATATWSVQLGEFTWDFSPFRDGMAEVYSLVRGLISWLLIGAYIRLVIGDCVSAMTEFMKTRGVGLPLMNAEAFGFGFNMGLTLWPLLVGALMVAWAGFLAFVLSAGFGFFGDVFSVWKAGPLVGLNGRAAQLVYAFFPVGLLVSLAFAYGVFRVTLVKAMVLAMAAVKWIMSA